jgi:type IV secretion/conjugal transfer VirB4 family ATPase
MAIGFKGKGVCPVTATATHTEIEPTTFLDDGVFATKSGQVGIVLLMTPPDSECMEEIDKAGVTLQFSAAMRQLDDKCRVYQYLIKRRVGPHYSFDTYLVLLRDGINLTGLRLVASAFGLQINAHPVSKAGAYAFLRRLLNYDETLARAIGLKYNEHMDYFASDSPIEAHRGFLRVGDHYCKILTLKDPPLTTVADMLQPLREIDAECIIVTEWRPIAARDARALIDSKKTHFHHAKYAAQWAGAAIDAISKLLGSSTATGQERPEDKQKDESAVAMEDVLGKLQKDIETNGTSIGEFALTVILIGTDQQAVDAATAEVFKAMSITGTVLTEEIQNVLAAWFAALPGGQRHQHRAIYLTSDNYAHLSLLFAPDIGSPRNEHLNAECLAVMKTRQNTPYHANLHYQDVGHALISGMTGSGKSYLANYLLENAIARYTPRVVIFDIGESYKALTARAGGSYLDIAYDGEFQNFTINPFGLPKTIENRQFLFAFVKVLMESGEYRMNDAEQDELYKVLMSAPYRLGDLVPMLSDGLRPHLARWTGDGQYARLFDNADDTLTCARFQTFEFGRMERYPQILQPLLFYILHRANADIDDPGFKIFLLDEAWKFLLNDTVRAYIYEALKTWRKKNAAMWLATQSIGDLEQSEMLRTVAENCGYLVLLPNPRMDREEYKRVFKLNERELDRVASMRPKSESLWKPAVGASKVVVLGV